MTKDIHIKVEKAKTKGLNCNLIKGQKSNEQIK